MDREWAGSEFSGKDGAEKGSKAGKGGVYPRDGERRSTRVNRAKKKRAEGSH